MHRPPRHLRDPAACRPIVALANPCGPACRRLIAALLPSRATHDAPRVQLHLPHGWPRQPAAGQVRRARCERGAMASQDHLRRPAAAAACRCRLQLPPAAHRCRSLPCLMCRNFNSPTLLCTLTRSNRSLVQRTAAAAAPRVAAGLGAAPAPAPRTFTGSSAPTFRAPSVAASAGYGNVDVRGAAELVQSGASAYVDVRCVRQRSGAGSSRGAPRACSAPRARACSACGSCLRCASVLGWRGTRQQARAATKPSLSLCNHLHLPLRWPQDRRGVRRRACARVEERARFPQTERRHGSQPAVPGAGRAAAGWPRRLAVGGRSCARARMGGRAAGRAGQHGS